MLFDGIVCSGCDGWSAAPLSILTQIYKELTYSACVSGIISEASREHSLTFRKLKLLFNLYFMAFPFLMSTICWQVFNILPKLCEWCLGSSLTLRLPYSFPLPFTHREGDLTLLPVAPVHLLCSCLCTLDHAFTSASKILLTPMSVFSVQASRPYLSLLRGCLPFFDFLVAVNYVL